jgi:sarcosine oxidase
MSNGYDVIVLGLGAMGSATVYNLAKLRKRVLGLDRFVPPHTHGSSHGETRITRQAIGEGTYYTPLAVRSHQLWREIEQLTGRVLLNETGCLIISGSTRTSGIHVADFFNNTIAAAEAFSIPHEVLDAQQIRSRFPQFNLREGDVGYYEPGGGFLRPEECITAQLNLAKQLGAEFHYRELVKDFASVAGGVRVVTDAGTYETAQLVVTAGPWLPALLKPEMSNRFCVYPQVLYWFDDKHAGDAFKPDNFPAFIWELEGYRRCIYGFPNMDGPGSGVKVATEQYDLSASPDVPASEVTTEDAEHMYEHYVKPCLPGLGEHCIKTATCFYTVTEGARFIIDRYPDMPAVLVVSPCSGHGFKHSAAIGEAVAEVITFGTSGISLKPFSFD